MLTRRIGAGLAALALAGCVASYAPPAPPSPQAATIAIPADTAWSRTLGYLAAAGIAVSASDRAGGVITAKPAMTPDQVRAWVDCGRLGDKPAAESVHMSRVVATGQLSVTIQPAGANAVVRPAFVVTATYDNAAPYFGGTSSVNCVSSGALERALLSAVSLPSAGSP